MENIIDKFCKVHGNKYDYSRVDYVKSTEKVEIGCSIHGYFWQTPHSHLKGCGCPECGKLSMINKKTITTDDFIKKAKKVHGNKYDYSNVIYNGSKNKVNVFCNKHGEFLITPNDHLQGRGCPLCAIDTLKEKLTDTNNCFIKKANIIHNNRYDYSKVNYVDSKTKICIICTEHGSFWQTPNAHLRGQKCPKCALVERSIKRTNTKDKFEDKANKIHKNKYIYTKFFYLNNQTKGEIICPEHGSFWQTPHTHLQGCGCPKCSYEYRSKLFKHSLNDFIIKANLIHNCKYSYEKSKYISAFNNICITCPKHGEFWQRPNDHLQGKGCPKCGHINSKVEDEISDIFQNISCEHNNRTILNGKEIDIYIPSLKLGIEYNGLRWHSEEFGKDRHYHLDKLNECNKKGINLIQIFEDEWINNRNIVIEKIKYIAHIDTGKEKIFARKCNIKEVKHDEAKVFLNKNHIQGYVGATVYLGLYHNDTLIALMDFKKEKEGYWDLNRFATDIKYNCVGAGGKLFKYFTKHYDYEEIKSFADRRWTINPTDNLYTKLGFHFDSVTQPEYRYFKEGDVERHHKFGFRKQILHKKYGLPLTMTEAEMTKELGYTKIWDCGLIKYVYNNNESKID